MNTHIEQVREAVARHKDGHVAGTIHTGGIFDPDGPDPRCNLWSDERTSGASSGELIAERITIANARRIAACWNACIGFPTAALEERGFLGSINDACEARTALANVLADALEVIQERADADCVDGAFVGNWAMNLAGEIEAALAKHAPNERQPRPAGVRMLEPGRDYVVVPKDASHG